VLPQLRALGITRGGSGAGVSVIITINSHAGKAFSLDVREQFGTGRPETHAYNVSLQTHEIGVRMALGAQQSKVLTMILTKGMRLVAAGMVIGCVASYGLTRFLASQIWGVSATDPRTFGTVAAIILTVGLAVCLLPARRATQVDPLIALRYE